jgi:small GTP-binding protein
MEKSIQKRVLVVEDDANVAFLIKEGLRDLGADYEIETVSSAEQALEKTAQTEWDLVITDHRMSGMTGLELIETLRERMPSTSSILITAFGSEDLELAAQRLNVYHYMTKPFPLIDLKHVIDQALWYNNESVPLKNKSEASTALKITLAGDDYAGKTALIKRLCTGKFDASRVLTMGADLHFYTIQNQNQTTHLCVWDMSGQTGIATPRRVFFRGSQAVGLVYDISNRQSFDHLSELHHEIKLLLPDVPIVLAGNKIDLDRQVSTQEGAALAHEWNAPFFETSCTTGEHVAEFFETLAQAAALYHD